MVDPVSIKKKECTIARSVRIAGIGLHTGKIVSVIFHPAPAKFGIVFRRIDLPLRPEIPALVEYVSDTARSTKLSKEGVGIQTVEHLLAAAFGLGIDNLLIEMDGPEPPIGDGSSRIFLDGLLQAKVQELAAEREIFPLNEPFYVSEGGMHIVALPSPTLRVSYTLSYPHSRPLKAQYYSSFIDSDLFCREIACCRSFSLYEEVAPLIDRGLIQGGSLDNSIVVHGDAVLSKGGLLFEDEMARHKVLDVLGDLYLVGFLFTAHIIAVRSGHALHKQLASKLREHFFRLSNHSTLPKKQP